MPVPSPPPAASSAAGGGDAKQKRLLRIVERLELCPDHSVLDLGCGHGFLAPLLDHAAGAYLGVDRKETNVGIARARAARHNLQRTRFERADMLDYLRQCALRFDKILLIDVDYMIDDARLQEILTQARAALTPRGRLYLHTVNGAYFLERLRDAGLVARDTTLWPHVRSAGDYRRLLAASGFDQAATTELGHFLAPLRWLNPLMALPGLRALFSARLFIVAA
jgi:cyclopropane fatty-acyl-phospholipid synthase-like methyltransferase